MSEKSSFQYYPVETVNGVDENAAESDWSKVLEAASKQGFYIHTSTPRNVPETNPGGSRTFQYAQNESKGVYDDEGQGVKESLTYYDNNKEILKHVPEVVIFTPDNKLIYVVSPNDALREIQKKTPNPKPIYEWPEEEQVLWRMAGWGDIHSSPTRLGNQIQLVMDFEPGLQKQFEENISKDPAKIREFLEKVAKERMHLEDYWREQNPETLKLQDFPTTGASSWKENPTSSIRPPWEFWEKLGLNEIFIQYSDSTKDKLHTEYRKIEN